MDMCICPVKIKGKNQKGYRPNSYREFLRGMEWKIDKLQNYLQGHITFVILKIQLSKIRSIKCSDGGKEGVVLLSAKQEVATLHVLSFQSLSHNLQPVPARIQASCNL